MKAWHFLKADKKLRYGDNRIVRPGVWMKSKAKELMMCDAGMHASKDILDALDYAPGPIVCRVELGGEMIHQDGKSCARKRRVIWMYDATNVLRKFARLCALDVIDKWDAPEVVIRYLKTGDESIRVAAWDAARAAARAAAGEKQSHRLYKMIMRSKPKAS